MHNDASSNGNWFSADPKLNLVESVSSEEAIQKLTLTHQKEIVVAAIDDDTNGFIDYIHGWNFMGLADGRHITCETLKVTREAARL